MSFAMKSAHKTPKTSAPPFRKQAGFTMGEMLIVIGIIGALTVTYKVGGDSIWQQVDKMKIQKTLAESTSTWRTYRSLRRITCDTTPANNPVLNDTDGSLLELLTGDYTNVGLNMGLDGAGLSPVSGLEKSGDDFTVAGFVHTLAFDAKCQGTATYAGMPTALLSALYGAMETQESLMNADLTASKAASATDNFAWTAPSAAGLHDVTITIPANQ